MIKIFTSQDLSVYKLLIWPSLPVRCTCGFNTHKGKLDIATTWKGLQVTYCEHCKTLYISCLNYEYVMKYIDNPKDYEKFYRIVQTRKRVVPEIKWFDDYNFKLYQKGKIDVDQYGIPIGVHCNYLLNNKNVKFYFDGENNTVYILPEEFIKLDEKYIEKLSEEECTVISEYKRQFKIWERDKELDEQEKMRSINAKNRPLGYAEPINPNDRANKKKRSFFS